MIDQLKEVLIKWGTQLALKARQKVARGKRAAKRSAPPLDQVLSIRALKRAIEKRDSGDGLGENYLSSWHHQ